LYFGRLSEEKGVATLIRAAAAANVPLWLVGTGPQQHLLETLSRSLSADVVFHGYKVGEALWDLVRRARAIVLPSEWYENAPISILESYALGKPVIGARIGGIPEMVLENETGWLYESGNVNALANVLEQVAKAPTSEVEELGVRARELVSQEYSPVRYYERLISLYTAHGVS
jgi:glycosyltransferase involved in cell wall biosynthesis